jgi:ABC-type uncharacterized transport system involved in gliding motility auxiliary subunit
MERSASFFGIVGGVLLGFGILGGFLAQSFASPLLLAHLLLGAILVALWFFVVGLKHLSEAGSVVKGRHSRFGLNALLYISVFVALVGMINWYVNKHDKKFDMTENKIFTLAPQTQTLLSNLKKNIKIVGLRTPEVGESINELLELFRSSAPSRITTEVIDPRAKPHLVEKYGMKPGNFIYVQIGDEASKEVSRVNEVTEEAITNAVIKLTKGEGKKVYIVQGHDEPSVEDTKEAGIKNFVLALEDENVKAVPLVLSQGKEVPTDAGAVILISPKKPLLPQEKEMLVKYGDDGGKLVLFSDPLGIRDTAVRGNSDMVEIANHFGITIRRDIVVDQMQRIAGAAVLGIQPFINDFSLTGITKGFDKSKVVVFNSSSSVVMKEGGKPDEFTLVASTSQTSWGETNLDLMFSQEPTAVLDKEDTAGPVPVAVSFEKKITTSLKAEAQNNEAKPEKVSRIVVFGDSDWITNSFLGYYSNRDLALNTVSWLLGEEGGVTIRPRTMKSSLAPITARSFNQLLAFSFVVPELILLFGLYVWWRRRQVSVA